MSNPQSKQKSLHPAGGKAEIFSERLSCSYHSQESIWTVKEALEKGARFLRERKIENPRLNAGIILGYVLEKSYSHLCLESHRLLSFSQLTKFRKLLIKRSLHQPLSYLIGREDFMNLFFLVNSKVYIPRPETEILVEEVLKSLRDSLLEAQAGRQATIIDLGTGCGNIAISLAKELPEAIVYAVDISDEALKVAAFNAELYHLKDRIVFLKGDLFHPLKGMNLTGKVDAIVSNPPYVARDEMESLPPEIRKEPEVALDGGEKGLEFYQKIIPVAPPFLRRGGLLALEVGHGQMEKIKDMIACQEDMQPPWIIKDYQGIERIVLSKKKVREER
jgi:release factor glutamine methyltransferase